MAGNVTEIAKKKIEASQGTKAAGVLAQVKSEVSKNEKVLAQVETKSEVTKKYSSEEAKLNK